MTEERPLSMVDLRCWCGGMVGARVPGDRLGLGCLADITHNWRAGWRVGEMSVKVEVRVARDQLSQPAVLLQLPDGFVMMNPDDALRVAWLLLATAAEVAEAEGSSEEELNQ